MKIIRNSIIPFKGFAAINLFGVVFVRKEIQPQYNITLYNWDKMLNHEMIHTAQMKELLYIPFYLWYVFEWLVRLVMYRDRHKAYRKSVKHTPINISGTTIRGVNDTPFFNTSRSMNREMKFRGKSLKYENWLFGSLWIDGEKYYIIHEKESEKAGENCWYNTYVTEVVPSTIGQYSGLKDKNGTEIYEGDIVKHRGYNGMQTSVVKFEAGAFIVGYHDGSSTKRRPMLLQDKVEVIGNIHDNPELLQ